MLQLILTIILLLTLICSATMVVRKRKRTGVTGIKSTLTPICFFLIGLISLLAYWFDFMGLAILVTNFILLVLAAYFTKYFPKSIN